MNRHSKAKRVTCALGAALLIHLTSGAACAQEAPALLEPVGLELDTAAAYVGTIEQVAYHEGAVRPYVEPLYFTLNGSVGEVHVVVGQRVKAGDALVTLDQEAEEERMEALRKAIEQQTTLDAFDVQLEKIELEMLQTQLATLRSAGASQDEIALKALDIEEMQLNQAYARELRRLGLAKLEEELETLEEDALGCVLRAPFDGCILYGKQMERGTRVGAYDPILYLADDTRLTVETAYISGGSLRGAKRTYAHIGDRDYAITPIEIDPQEYVTRTLSGEKLTTEFTLDAPDEALQAGQFAAVFLVTKYKEDALLVPSNAIYHDASGRYVYVVDDGGERIRTAVKIGLSTDWLVEITEGIEEGAVVYVKE